MLPMKNIKISIIPIILCFIYIDAAFSADLSYLLNKDTCHNGGVLKYPSPLEEHTLFSSKLNEVNINYSLLTIEKTKDSWLKEYSSKKIDDYNKMVCPNKITTCTTIKDLKTVRTFNNFRIDYLLTMSSPLDMNELITLFKKNNLEVIELKKSNNSLSPSEKHLAVEYSSPRDLKSRGENPYSFESVVEYLEYRQLNYGSFNMKVYLTESTRKPEILQDNKNNKNSKTNKKESKTDIIYSCSFSFPAQEDAPTFANKYKVMYYGPTANITK